MIFDLTILSIVVVVGWLMAQVLCIVGLVSLQESFDKQCHWVLSLSKSILWAILMNVEIQLFVLPIFFVRTILMGVK